MKISSQAHVPNKAVLLSMLSWEPTVSESTNGDPPQSCQKSNKRRYLLSIHKETGVCLWRSRTGLGGQNAQEATSGEITRRAYITGALSAFQFIQRFGGSLIRKPQKVIQECFMNYLWGNTYIYIYINTLYIIIYLSKTVLFHQTFVGYSNSLVKLLSSYNSKWMKQWFLKEKYITSMEILPIHYNA